MQTAVLAEEAMVAESPCDGTLEPVEGAIVIPDKREAGRDKVGEILVSLRSLLQQGELVHYLSDGGAR